MGDKDKLIVAMFLAASLTLNSGCGSEGGSGHVHVDANGDGYCDECKSSMSHHSGTGSGFSRVMNSVSANSSSDGHISTGTAAHGGIGSHGTGGGG